jgi:DNA-binding XRE family transcriptional regulator
MRTLRLSAGLTQTELGILLGVSEDVIGNCEREVSNPVSTVLLGCTLLFGAPTTDLFPALYREVQEKIGRGAAVCDTRWRDRTDAQALKKLGFLQKVVERTTPFSDA